MIAYQVVGAPGLIVLDVSFSFHLNLIKIDTFIEKRMAIDVLKSIDIIELMENYVAKIRPSEEIRTDLDIGYRIENQSVILVEIRPDWRDKKIIREYGYAKSTYVKSKDVWKIYWMRADGNWHLYKANPEVKGLRQFLDIVNEDKYNCFKG